MTEILPPPVPQAAAAAPSPAPTETAPPPAETPVPPLPGAAPPPSVKPEDYGDFTFPQGFEVDDSLVGEFKGLSASLGLSKDQAQKLIDFRATQHQSQKTALDHQAAQWVEQAKSDKEFGGVDFAKNLAIADRAIATYGTPELRTLLDAYGLGNHPELVRFAYRAGLKVTEPGPVDTRSPALGAVDHAAILYPSTP